MKCHHKNFALDQKYLRIERQKYKREYPNRFKYKSMESINWFRALDMLPWWFRMRIEKIQFDNLFNAR